MNRPDPPPPSGVTLVFIAEVHLDEPVPGTLEDAVQALQAEFGHTGIVVLDVEDVVPDA